MRNYAEETEKRVQFIRQAVADAHADGILFGNSDSFRPGSGRIPLLFLLLGKGRK